MTRNDFLNLKNGDLIEINSKLCEILCEMEPDLNVFVTFRIRTVIYPFHEACIDEQHCHAVTLIQTKSLSSNKVINYYKPYNQKKRYATH